MPNSENMIICIPLAQANGAVYPNFCPIRLSMAGSWPTMVVTGNGEYGLIPEREPEIWLPHPRMAAGEQIIQF